MMRSDEPGPRVCERALVWHLGDSRLDDQAALSMAATSARAVFPLAVRDAADPLTRVRGYDEALQALARDYRELGTSLAYLEGDSETMVVDAARDARVDYVYVLAREDAFGRACLLRVKEELASWGFNTCVFSDSLFTEGVLRRLWLRPASLAGHALPSYTLREARAWGERELLAELHEMTWEDLLEPLSLGLISRRLLWDKAAQLRDRLLEHESSVGAGS